MSRQTYRLHENPLFKIARQRLTQFLSDNTPKPRLISVAEGREKLIRQLVIRNSGQLRSHPQGLEQLPTDPFGIVRRNRLG